MLKIKFTDVTGEVSDQFYPVPAKEAIPEWLKNLPPYIDKDFKVLAPGVTNQTAKRCIPMLDAVMTGYLIRLTHDIHVEKINGNNYFQWRSGSGIDFHSKEQATTNAKVAASGDAIPKWLSPWSIETPPGYSTMFIPPLNSDSTLITPFSGVVDTDKYLSPTAIPFLIDPAFKGVLEAGTPLIQVIPFKREVWRMETLNEKTKKIKNSEKILAAKFRNAYRKFYWTRKDYS